MAGGLVLVECEAGEVEARLVKHNGGDCASPSEGADVVFRGESDVLDGPVATVNIGQVHQVSAGKKLIET